MPAGRTVLLNSVLTGALMGMASAACVAAGTASLIDAADGWQEVLRLFQAMVHPTCGSLFVVPGLGDGAVLVFATVAICLLVLMALTSACPGRWMTVAQALSVVTLFPIALLWLDAVAVGAAPSTDCDAMGLGGAASAAINRAGWLFAASMILSLLCLFLLRARESHAPLT
jgi:hypothetical protein